MGYLIMNKLIKAATIAAIAVFGTSASAASIVNGSFEAPPATVNSFNTYAAGSGLLSGWTISNANIDHIGDGFWEASDGGQSVDLNGNQGAATISQTITGLNIGDSYTVFFDMAGNFQGAPAVKTMDVSIGMAAFASYTFATTGATSAAMGWTTKSLSFIAGGTSGLLSFASTTSGCCFGPALDNVRIQNNSAVIPLPAGGLLLISALGGLALTRRRKG